MIATNAQAWAILLGIVTPLIVAIAKRPKMSKRAVQMISLGSAIVVGAGNLLVQGFLSNVDWSFGTGMGLIAAVVGASQAAYVLLWSPSGVEPAIDTATSPPQVVVV